MVLGTPRSSKPLASSEQQGGGSIPILQATLDRVACLLYLCIDNVLTQMGGPSHDQDPD